MTTLNTRPLKGQSLEELRDFFTRQGMPGYRGEQLFRWIYQKQATSFEEITTLSKELRRDLSASESLERGTVVHQTSRHPEQTVKFLIRLADDRQVESVYIPSDDRVTICVSSQVGCALDCDFCATGKMGFQRHLDAGEIFEQYRILQQFSPRPITNIVFMGMGEPFNNYHEVLRAADLFHHELGPHISRHRITISTAGVVPKIRQFTREDRPYKLAISLNATRDDLREALMPLNRRWPLQELLQAARQYTDRSGDRITFEYVLLEGYSDSPEDARRLIRLLGELRCKVNVIPFNEIGYKYSRPSDQRMEAFMQALQPAPFPVTVRWSRGQDISAACGQLRTELENTPEPEIPSSSG